MKNFRISLILMVSSSLIFPILSFDDFDGAEIVTASNDQAHNNPDTEIIQTLSRTDRLGKANPKPQDKRFTSVMSSGFFPQPQMLPPTMMQPQAPSYQYPYYPPAMPPQMPVYPQMQQSYWPGYYFYDGFDMIMVRNGRKKGDNAGNSQNQQQSGP